MRCILTFPAVMLPNIEGKTGEPVREKTLQAMTNVQHDSLVETRQGVTIVAYETLIITAEFAVKTQFFSWK